MKYYLAPLEGITGYIFRNTYEAVYGGIDKYFTPFVAPNRPAKFSPKEKRDINPDNNKVPNLTPQILTNRADVYVGTAKALKNLGYSELNLNLGCPSGTVVSKNRGSGFLALPEELDRFLDQIFAANEDLGLTLSIKTRLGVESYEEFPRLLDIYNKYPLKELIIHPRLRVDMYKRRVNLEDFEYAYKNTDHKLGYNGDMFTKGDIEKILSLFPNVDSLMFGRGILMNPNLLACHEDSNAKLKEFLDLLLAGYRELIPDSKNVLMKMKEIWFYLQENFPDGHKIFKKIKKCNSLEEYENLCYTFIK